MKRQREIFLFCLALSLSSCSWLTSYKMDIRQGNYETVEMVSRVKVGMTKEQVRSQLGTPLLIDTFHEDRWDYIYRFRKGNQRDEQAIKQTVSVFFDSEGLVARTEVSDALPSDPQPLVFRLLPAGKGDIIIESAQSRAVPIERQERPLPKQENMILEDDTSESEDIMNAEPL